MGWLLRRLLRWGASLAFSAAAAWIVSRLRGRGSRGAAARTGPSGPAAAGWSSAGDVPGSSSEDVARARPRPREHTASADEGWNRPPVGGPGPSPGRGTEVGRQGGDAPESGG